MLTLSLLGGPATINGTVVSLQGSALLAPAVDSQVTVAGAWTFTGASLTSNQTTSPPRQHTTTLTFDPLSVGGDYVFTVTVSSGSPYLQTSSANASYTLSLQPYPPLVVVGRVSGGECVVNEVATLTGSVDLLSNTATDHTLSYTWTGPGGLIPASTQDLTLREGTLVVGNLGQNSGQYGLMVCLAIPSTDVVGHCSETSYTISTDG